MPGPATVNHPVQPFIVDGHTGFTTDYEQGLRLTSMRDNAWRRHRFFHLAQLFGLARNLPGATAEAGVFRGLGSYLMCSRSRREHPGFDGAGHFAIDSFEGLGQPSAEDGPAECAGRFSDTSLEVAQSTLADFPAVTFLKGWIPEVFDQLPDQHYRFVHVDVDLYDPTLASLEYFYPRLTPGGVLVVDDYGPWPNGDFPGCKRAVEGFAAEHGLAFAGLDTGNAVFVRR